MTRLLLFRFGALGDLLLATPALAATRWSLPGAHLALVGHEEAVSLLASLGLVDEGISQDDPRLLNLFSSREDPTPPALRLDQFDAVIAWLGEPEGPLAGNLRRWAKRALIAPAGPPEGALNHMADHLLESLAPLGIESSGGSWPRLRPLPEADAWARLALSVLGPVGAPVVAIHPGSGSPRKNWPASDFARTASLLKDAGVPVVVVSGPADEAVVREMQEGLAASLPIYANLPLPRLSALLGRCKVYLGNDSGVTHLAALSGAPTVALFGPTDPNIWAPRGDAVTVLRWNDNGERLSPEHLAEILLELAR